MEGDSGLWTVWVYLFGEHTGEGREKGKVRERGRDKVREREREV